MRARTGSLREVCFVAGIITQGCPSRGAGGVRVCRVLPSVEREKAPSAGVVPTTARCYVGDPAEAAVFMRVSGSWADEPSREEGELSHPSSWSSRRRERPTTHLKHQVLRQGRMKCFYYGVRHIPADQRRHGGSHLSCIEGILFVPLSPNRMVCWN
jgi:hypothetical protein